MASPQGLLSPLERQTYESFGIAPREDRLSLLPRYNAKTGLVAPQFVYDAAKALAAPYTAAQGYDLPPEEAINVGMNMMGGGAVGTAPKGALRTFIGRNANNWNKAAESQFVTLEKQGVSPEEIWKQTGTFRGLDGKLRQEFSDKNATAAFTHLQESGTNRLAEKAINNPLYEKNYPYLSKVSSLGLRQSEPAGSFEWSYFDNPQQGSGYLVAKSPNVNELKSVGVHEMQHGIQKLEGFSPGTNLQQVKLYDIPSVYIKRADKLMDKAEKLTEQNKLEEANKVMSERNKILMQGKYATYSRNAGEVEARLAQRRMDLTDAERRANFPLNRGLLGIDVNPNKINF
jgi:hypothetical protein